MLEPLCVPGSFVLELPEQIRLQGHAQCWLGQAGVSVVPEQTPQLPQEVTSPLAAWLVPAHVCDYGKKPDACAHLYTA